MTACHHASFPSDGERRRCGQAMSGFPLGLPLGGSIGHGSPLQGLGGWWSDMGSGLGSKLEHKLGPKLESKLESKLGFKLGSKLGSE